MEQVKPSAGVADTDQKPPIKEYTPAQLDLLRRELGKS